MTRAAPGGKLQRQKIMVRNQFERYAEGYDLERALRRRRVEKYGEMPRRLLRRGIRVDLGCGTGVYSRELSFGSKLVVGIDFSPKSLDIARRYYPSGSFILGDLEYLPLKDASVDAFFSFSSIYYLSPEGQQKLFREIYRALRGGGNVLFIEPNAQNILAFERWRHRLERLTHPLRGDEVKELLKGIGFKKIAFRFSGFMPEFVKRKERRFLFILFRFLESVMEFFQVPQFLGTIVVYAEK